MSSIVIELQREALDRKLPVSDLLRKALVVSRKLGQTEFQVWIERELNGYGVKDDIPEYREVVGDIRGWNPYRGWIPLIFEDSEEGRRLSKRKSSQSLAELEHLIDGRERGGMLHMPFPLEVQRALSKGFGFETQVSLMTPTSSIVGMIDAVRTIVLNWALQLEESGVLGEGMSFSTEEKQAAKATPQNITNYFGPVQSALVQQGNAQANQIVSIAHVDVAALTTLTEKLASAIPKLSLDDSKAAEANAELATLRSQIASPNPKKTIVAESLKSLRSILEGAGGGVAAQLLIEVGKLLI
jgi:hypothetical protein